MTVQLGNPGTWLTMRRTVASEPSRVSVTVTSLFVLSSLAHGKGFHSMPMEKVARKAPLLWSLVVFVDPRRVVRELVSSLSRTAILSLFCSFCMSEASSNSQWTKNVFTISRLHDTYRVLVVIYFFTLFKMDSKPW